MKGFKEITTDLVYGNAELVMIFQYNNNDKSVYKKIRKGIHEFYLIDWNRETIRRIDYKDLATIGIMLSNCNIDYPKT